MKPQKLLKNARFHILVQTYTNLQISIIRTHSMMCDVLLLAARTQRRTANRARKQPRKRSRTCGAMIADGVLDSRDALLELHVPNRVGILDHDHRRAVVRPRCAELQDARYVIKSVICDPNFERLVLGCIEADFCK